MPDATLGPWLKPCPDGGPVGLEVLMELTGPPRPERLWTKQGHAGEVHGRGDQCLCGHMGNGLRGLAPVLVSFLLAVTKFLIKATSARAGEGQARWNFQPTVSARLPGQPALDPPVSQCWGSRHLQLSPAFPRVLMLTEEAPLPTEPPLQPHPWALPQSLFRDSPHWRPSRIGCSLA